jgi:hypothetical protein
LACIVVNAVFSRKWVFEGVYMKRYSLIQARGGDFAGCADAGAAVEGEGNDVIELVTWSLSLATN